MSKGDYKLNEVGWFRWASNCNQFWCILWYIYLSVDFRYVNSSLKL